MSDWSKQISNISNIVTNAVSTSVQSVITDYANKAFQKLKESTPIGETSNLVKSLSIESITKLTKYGYRIFYDGYDDNGRPYQVIANALNRGFTTPQGKYISGTHFIDEAIKTLKGMDQKINEVWKLILNNPNDKGD